MHIKHNIGNYFLDIEVVKVSNGTNKTILAIEEKIVS